MWENMSKKIYVCRNCGYTFPDDLSHHIESKSQVFCERCGTPFSLEGTTFKEELIKSKTTKGPSKKESKEKTSTLESIIRILNKISWIPILIFSIIMLIIPENILLGIAGIFISLYDLKVISKKVKKKEYNDIILDPLCFGILGCIIFGTGILILIKGVLILINVIINSTEEPPYMLGLKMKNSLNRFSAFGGIIIIILGLHIISRVINRIPAGFLVFSISIAILVLIIDILSRKKIKRKEEFGIGNGIWIIFIGILGLFFAASSIFILIKGVIIFLLAFGNLPEKPLVIQESLDKSLPLVKAPIEKLPPQEKPIKPEQKKEIIQPSIKHEEIPIIKEEKVKKTKEEKEKEIELRIHESLLPVKDEKDKKLVKEYFSKIFSLLSKDLREQIKDLKIPEKDKKELLNELAFLTKEEQIKYIEAIVNLYQEQLPLKLIERLRSLPNIKPEHLIKIAEQLKFMDFDEQEQFVQFLENNA